MTRLRLNRLLGIATAIVIALVSNTAAADHVGQTAVADGVLIYLGVMPATDRYDNKIEIKRTVSPEVIHARFTYRPYGD